MKKVLSIFLLIIYTWSAFGAVSMVSRKCNDYFSHISFLGSEAQSTCSCTSDTSMPKDCCKDHVVCQKVDIHKTLQESFTLNTNVFTPDLLPVSTLYNLAFRGGGNGTDAKTSNSYTKRSCPQPIYLLISVFRI